MLTEAGRRDKLIYKNMKNSNTASNSVNAAEIILVILIGIFISVVFFMEINSISSRISKVEDQTQLMQSELVNLRIKMNSQTSNPVNQNSPEKPATGAQTTQPE
jgi:cytochrome bd-type quinol oxidase subunit 1